MWPKQHRKEGQLGFSPPSPYSNGVHKRINCRGGAWPVLLKAWDNLQGLRWLFAVCSLALQQRRGLRDPSPHGGADRSWCIPDIFCLLVFHREGSEWACCSNKESPLSLICTSYLRRSVSLCSWKMNVLSVRNKELNPGKQDLNY